MKITQLFLVLAAVAVDASSTRRLRRGVNARYLNLAGEVDETTMNRVAVRHEATIDEDRHLTERQLQDSMSLRVMSMSMSLPPKVESVGDFMSGEEDPKPEPPQHLPFDPKPRRYLEEDVADLSNSMSMKVGSMSLVMSL